MSAQLPYNEVVDTTQEAGGDFGEECVDVPPSQMNIPEIPGARDDWEKYPTNTPEAEKKGEGEAPNRIGTYDVPGILSRSGASGPRYRIGIESIDERLTLASQPDKVGLPLGRILGIEGPPHSGKSLMICQATLALVRQGLRVLSLVSDEPREDAAERYGQGLGFRHAELNGNHPDTIQGVRAALSGLDLQLLPDDENDEHPPTIEEAAAVLLSVENENGYILAVDSINKARSTTERDADSNRERIEHRMSAFRRLRRENGRRLSILFTAEANRASYASRDESQHASAMASGAESRDLEFVSDVLLVLKAKKGDDLVRVEIPKNRVGRKYEPLSLRRHDGSASLHPVSEEAVEMEAEGKESEKDFADRTALIDKIVSLVAERNEPLSKRAIERTLKGLAKKFGGRQAVRDAIDSATEDFTPPRLEKVPAAGRKGGGGFAYRIFRPEAQEELKT